MVRPRAKYAAEIAAVVAANRVIGAQRNPRFDSQRRAYQLQKTPSPIGSAKAPNADSAPLRARRPSMKSVARATTDVQPEPGASQGSRDLTTVNQFGHPNLHRSPTRPSRVMPKNPAIPAHRPLPPPP